MTPYGRVNLSTTTKFSTPSEKIARVTPYGQVNLSTTTTSCTRSEKIARVTTYLQYPRDDKIGENQALGRIRHKWRARLFG